MPGSGKSCHLFLLLTLLLLSGPIAAQNTKETKQETALRLIKEGQQLVDEGSAASLKKAIEKFEAAKILAHAVSDVAADGILLSKIGSLYKTLEQHQKALEKYEQSLPLLHAVGDRRNEALSLTSLGEIYIDLGERQKALDNLSQAVLLSRSARDREIEAGALILIGSLHIGLGNYEESFSHFNKALELCRTIGAHEGEAIVLAGLGLYYTESGNTQKARESYEQALSVSRAAGFPYAEAMALIGLGNLYNYLLDDEKAIEYYEQTLALFRAERNRLIESIALHGLCVFHLNSRNFQRGFDYCAQALKLLESDGNHYQKVLILGSIASGEFRRGNLAASQAAIESAIAIIESLRTKVINPALRLSSFTNFQKAYEFYVDLLMHLHKLRPNEGYDGKALEASERARARSLLETLGEANADIRQGVDAALLQREREIQRRLNAKAQTQMLFPSLSRSEAQSRADAEEIQTLIKDLQQVETEIRQTSPRYAALTQPRPLTLKEIQTQVLDDDDTLLLEYSLGEDRSYLWLVTSSSLSVHELPKGAEIETAARHFYDLLNARNVRVKNESNEERADRIAQADGEMPLAAESLSRMVLAPVAGKLGNKRLIIVADGALHFVPFGVLPSIDRQGTVTRPLIVDHEIVNLASASTLAVVRKEVAGRQMAPKSVVALADPVFMKNDERVKAVNKPPAGDEGAKDRQLVKAAAEDTGVANNGLYVPRLPGTRKEAEQIVAMVPPGQGRLALDFAASRETVMSAELSQYRYVHLSTHGFLNSVHPELSGVVFSLVNERGESQEGFLRSHELFNLKLPAEVVVLSACQTGLGKNIRGEGVVSLTRGFMYAGAPRVVVSLWAVSDWGTTELMMRFYHGMLKEGMRPAAALRAAQISLMNDKRFASPYYWAPFTLHGEWR